MNELIQELKVKIIETLNLVDVSPEDIHEDTILFGDELNLDSIDVLELVMMLDKDYGVKIDSKELGVKVFVSMKSLAEYVYNNRSEKSN
jgi:acyl carrier protein